MAWPKIFKRGPGTALNGGNAKEISPLVQALIAAQSRIDSSTPLYRPMEWVQAEFGPGWPLTPDPLDTTGPSGQPEPRISEYPVAVNIYGSHERGVIPWDTLKKAAETPLFRACIEIRKKEIASLDWAITVSKSTIANKAKNEGRAEHDVEKELRDQYKSEIERATEFWTTPDKRNGRDFATWISLLLEEHLTWDAMALYPRKTYGGELLDFMVIDGSTIKCLLDEQGGRPEPPPAYQQVLYGFPRGEFSADTATVDGQEYVPGALSSAQLVYERRVHRTWTPYGFSPTEQALLDGMLWSKRFAWMMAEYTEGAQAVEWLVNKGTSDWTPRQVLEYEKALNDRMGGKTSERYRNPLLPPGIEPIASPTTPERYKPDYDLFIIKLVAAHFDVTIAELGFTEPGGLGSAGYHEGQADVQWRRATLPDTRWLKSFLTRIQTQHLGTPAELEFTFLGLDDEDEAAADAVADARTKRAVYTLNEDRARLGLPAYPFKEANMPMMQTARGVVFVEGASEQAPPGVMIEPQSEQLPNSGDATAQGASPAKPGPTSVKPPSQAAKAALELVTWRAWEKKHAAPDRAFRFEHMTPELAAELEPALLGDARAELVKAGGARPKSQQQQQPQWSAWKFDLALVTVFATALAAALGVAFAVGVLIAAWLAARPDGSTKADALMWLEDRGVEQAIAAKLWPVMRQYWAEAYGLGVDAAQDATGFDGQIGPQNLDDLINTYGQEWVNSIARTVTERIAGTLAGSGSLTAAELEQQIHDVLKDEGHAKAIALTEITRASGEATVTVYQAASVEQVIWVTDPASNVCALCDANQAAGPRFLGTPFPSGAIAPPQHVRCRCALLPYRS